MAKCGFDFLILNCVTTQMTALKYIRLSYKEERSFPCILQHIFYGDNMALQGLGNTTVLAAGYTYRISLIT